MSSALYEYAKKELERIEKGCEDKESLSMQQAINKNILELIDVFSNQHHSGFTASYVIDILQRLLHYKPLTPLTGEDDEWEDVTSYGYDTPTFQNKRCSAVFKDDKGAYWVEGKIFSSDLGHTWYTNSDSCVPVTFPFNVPDKSEVVVIDNKEDREEILDDIKTVRICALTNGIVKPIDFKNINIGNAEVSFSIWDIDRLYRCVMSGKMRETIEIDFQDKFNMTIPCIENATSDKYSVYLAIISGELLAGLYDEFRDRLLEKNVRSFLQVMGAVNKGIRDTLRDEPDMFLAYNNVISVTAESVEIVRDENGKPSIKSIRDMQIVNGGQTTASIFNAHKDKKINADLSKVFVQMKISVITSSDDMDEIVPRISAFANTQNKVQIADFSANDPFHRRIEELSRTIWAPAQGGLLPQNWFYERARGQYADMLARESTTLRRKKYKEQHPLFTKTDLAKYENTWDQLPFYVSEGAQKNFRRFTIRMSQQKRKLPDEQY